MEKLLINLWNNIKDSDGNLFNGDTLYWPLRRGKPILKAQTCNEVIASRSLISNKFKKNKKDVELQQFILKKFAGIHRFNSYDKVPTAIESVLVARKKENQLIEKNVANTIAAYSQLFSFYDPEHFFILDARIIYSLNKLYYQSRSKESDLFPILFQTSKTRNASLKERGMDLNLKFNKLEFKDIQFAYLPYCSFITNMFELFQNKNLFEGRRFKKICPEIIEMFLFFIADHI